ncbi:hypothetical protein HHK36_003218 [Tetracentron sinense]|uniref:Late embryogenesis abundant protein LEA-2 subgroup domain-containing protein n=1 Tax=Tetracentron sinense TaxID=13715 RepID=A0A834ZS51_TETSI|nr:hypothetical protein HHK36_003218 [Tetracentron sinense]
MCQPNSFYQWLLQVLVLIGLLSFFLWLGLRPKHPTYTIANFNIPLNDRNTTSPTDEVSRNTTTSFDLEISNPNKDAGIYYDNIIVTLFFGDASVGETTIPSFYQGKHKTHTIPESLNADGRIWNAALRAILNGTTEVKVGVVTRIRYRMSSWKSKRHRMDMQGNVPVGSDGKISGKKKKIKLHHSSKKWRSRLT